MTPGARQAGLHVLELLVRASAGAGATLAGYYRQLLPPLAAHVDDNLNIGDRIDYGEGGGGKKEGIGW